MLWCNGADTLIFLKPILVDRYLLFEILPYRIIIVSWVNEKKRHSAFYFFEINRYDIKR